MRKAKSVSRKGVSLKKALKKSVSTVTGFPDLGVEIRKSKIHGRGVFATKFFGAGWFIGTITGIVKAMPDIDCPYSLWFDDSRGRYSTMIPDPPFKFLNHSKECNAEIDLVSLYASDNILPGDEITIFYSNEWEEGRARTRGINHSPSNNEEDTSE